MESNSIVKSITNAFTDDLTPLPEFSQRLTSNPGQSITKSIGSSIFSGASESESSWFTFNWQTIIIIILVLALLGFNIFLYLARGTSELATSIRSVFGPVLSFFGLATVNVANQAIQGAAEGTSAVANTVSSASQTATDTIKGADAKMAGIDGSSVVQQSMQQQQIGREDALRTALNDASQGLHLQEDDIMPSDASSSYTGKSGWCYIGEEDNVRTCAKVGVNDKCMSGDIFPTQDVCVNPNLRV